MPAARALCRLFVTGVLGGCLSSTALAQSAADPYYEFLIARRLEAQGDAAGALAALDRAAAADPRSAEIRAELASFQLRQNNSPKAEAEAKAALALRDDVVEAHRVLGLIYATYAEDATEKNDGPRADRYAAQAIAHLERVMPTPAAATDATLQYNLGLLYLRGGDTEKAMARLARVVDMQPYSVQARFALARAQSAANRVDDAIETLKPAVDDEPRLTSALAQFYEQAGRYNDAAEAYAKALEANPTSRELKVRLASALLSAPGTASAGRAADVLTSLLQTNSRDTRALYLRSQAHRRAGDLQAAEADAKALLSLEPDEVSGIYALAQVYGQARRHAHVVALVEPYVAKAPSRPGLSPVLTYLGFAYQSLGEHAKAIDAFERARALAPGEPSHDAYLVQAHLDAKRYAEAAVLAAEAQKRHPREARFTRLHARALFRTGAASRAIALLESSLKSNPEEVSAYLALADMYAEATRVDQGMRVLDQAAQRFPKDASIPFQRGAILEKAGRYAEAEAAFRRTLEIDTEHADALNYLGYMLAERGERLDEAIALITRALALDHGNPSYMDSLGWALFRRGRLQEAETHLSQAAEALPRNSVVQDHLGDLLARLGRYPDAVAAWTRALGGDGEEIDRAAIEKKIRDVQRRAQR